MPSLVRSWPASPVLLLVAAFACALRLSGFFGTGGPLGAPTGYDDGVYFSSSALFTRGLLPYRDFVFVHPPGILYVLATVSWWPDPAIGFSAARVLASIAGGVTALLVGTLVARAAGPVPGIVAALLYAVYPDAVVAEQSTFIEPALNLLVLSSALLWLDGRHPLTRRRGFVSGLLCGAACVAKLWGGLWVVASIVAAPERRSRASVFTFVAGVTLAGVALVAPVALPAPGLFIEQTLAFQFARPPDGASGWLPRLLELADSDHRSATVFSSVALGSIAVRLARGRLDVITRPERMFAVAMLLTALGLLFAPTYWRHYNAHLAASQCALAGFGVAVVLRMPRITRAAAITIVALTIVLLDFRSVPRALQHSRARSPEMLMARASLPELVPAHASVFAFDPAWGLVAGRLPEHRDEAPVVPDSYAVMLLDAVKEGGTFADTESAFEHTLSQPTIRARLDASDAVMLGWRGTWQLNDTDGAWFASHFECRNPEVGDLCIWTRRPAPVPGAPLEDQFVQFDDGWYSREGVPPDTWRWMGERAVMRLPARRGSMRLELAFDVPLAELGAAPVITIELDGELVERFRPEARDVRRSFDVQVSGTAPHVLTVTSDESFSPARSGTSNDTRVLALKLTSVAWTRADRAAPFENPSN